MAFLAKQIFSTASGLVLKRSIQTTAAKASGLRKWAFNSAGYNKYGLLTDDCMDEMNEDIKEAVRRLPQKLVDERNYRMLRAIQLNIQKSILPKEQWTKFEDDVRYLKPYLEEVRAERKEIADWEATH